jgi:hypothetical protein
MTGTGTKTDPYIISTWDELTTTVTQNDVYIELGSDIDGKELGAITIPNTGGSGSYPLNCALLDGKDHSIKNIFLLDSPNVFSGVKANTIKNLTFTNIYLSHSSLFLFDDQTNLPTFINCHFNSECVNRSEFIDNRVVSLYATAFRKCTFHIQCKNSEFTRTRPYSVDRRPILLDDCVLELYGEFYRSIFSAQLVNTYVTGEVSLTEIDDQDPDPAIKIVSAGCYEYYSGEFMKSNSIVDLIVHNKTGKTSIPYMVYNNINYYDDVTGDAKETTPTLFVNTEVLENFERDTGYGGTYHACTSAQIHDETYLRSERFIAEEIFDNRFVRKESLNCLPYNNGGSGCYIDTGIINSSERRTSISWEYTGITNERWAMGAVDAYDWGGGMIFGTVDGSTLYDFYDSTPSYDVPRSVSYYGIVGTKIHGVSNPTNWRHYQNKYNMVINGRCYDGDIQRGIDGKIYRATIWETDNSLLRDFVPVYDKVNHVYGMYDMVNGVFYGSETEVPFNSADDMPFRFVGDTLTHNMQTSVLRSGAFYNTTNLIEVRIPETVKSIGRFAFANTKLKKVKIASDCEYYDTSFPRDCEIEFYE